MSLTGSDGPSRRELLLGTLGLPLLTAFAGARLDRRALVERHSVVLDRADLKSPLQVGNGEFAVTVDITGLQTFSEAYEDAMPLGTMAQWAWHEFPNDSRLDIEDIYTSYESHGRLVPYADGKGGYSSDAPPDTSHPAVWRRANPHRIDLGRIGLMLVHAGGRTASLADIERPRQVLDLWNGRIESRFTFSGEAVEVATVCHPKRDALAVRVRSRLVRSGGLGIFVLFTYPAGEWKHTVNWTADASRHKTRVTEDGGATARFDRRLDATRFVAAGRWTPTARLVRRDAHRFEVLADTGHTIELCIEFAERPPADTLSYDLCLAAATSHWRRFWNTGGAIDLSSSPDHRARELERRIVLSQYLTAVNCAGSVPPQETGLVTNSWYGKHHLEMHWWHAAHFVLWGRPHLLERSLAWYAAIAARAREAAGRQGYDGARWPKQVGIDGRESPSAVSPFLVWQQPHYIFFAELLYRAHSTREILDRHADLVFATADFMASFAARSQQTGRYVLGPPLIPAQETYGPIKQRVINPTFELAYWAWGLSVVQSWRERLGLGRDAAWDRVTSGLSQPTIRNGVYAAIGVEPFTERSDHPSMLGALGVLPQTPLIDPEVMRRTLADVRRSWDWQSTWGWDYPLMAMTAARLGETAAAVDALMMDSPKNHYLPNGHNFQSDRLPLYLPGNGGLLYAVGMMAAGWDGGPKNSAPGFPADGQWIVRSEGLLRAP